MSLVNDARLVWTHHRLSDAIRGMLRQATRPAKAACTVPLDEPRLLLSDVVATVQRRADLLRLTRPVDTGTEMEHSTPGARLGFVTDSRRVDFLVRFQRFGRYLNPGCSIGVVLVDGSPHQTYMGRDTGHLQTISVHLPRGRHHVELVWPYCRGMEVVRLRTCEGAILESPPSRPDRRVLLVGDSITQGLTSAGITRTWPFLLSRALEAEVLNFGFSSRRAHAIDGPVAGAIPASVAVYMIGVGDYFHQVDLASFRTAVAGFMEGFKRASQGQPLVVVTALHADLRPTKPERWSLEAYRTELREAGREAGLSVIDGLSCMTPHRSRLRRDKVHLNDRGAAEVAASLTEKLAPMLLDQPSRLAHVKESLGLPHT